MTSSVTFIKSVNQSSIKPCLSCPLCLKLAFIGVSTGGLVSNAVFDTRLSHLRLIENENASKNISETAFQKEKLLIGFFSCGSIKVRRQISEEKLKPNGLNRLYEHLSIKLIPAN